MAATDYQRYAAGVKDSHAEPPAHPAEQSCAGVGTRTHDGIVLMNDKPTWVIGLAHKGMGQGWTRRPVLQMASPSTTANSATLYTTPNSF
jgi:hypothetical protein